MNKIKKFKEELENYEKKYALLIKECIQEEINKINPEIEISIRSNDVNSIYVIYKNFNFEFRYVYFKCKNNEKLFSEGMEKLIPVDILMIDIQKKSRKNESVHMIMYVQS